MVIPKNLFLLMAKIGKIGNWTIRNPLPIAIGTAIRNPQLAIRNQQSAISN
jgi:hypothetical protein